jgi:hypothetical protein
MTFKEADSGYSHGKDGNLILKKTGMGDSDKSRTSAMFKPVFFDHGSILTKILSIVNKKVIFISDR